MFFAERPAIPTEMLYSIEGDHLGVVKETVTREGIVRDLEADVFMSLPVAKALHDWLGTQIALVQDPAGEVSK